MVGPLMGPDWDRKDWPTQGPPFMTSIEPEKIGIEVDRMSYGEVVYVVQEMPVSRDIAYRNRQLYLSCESIEAERCWRCLLTENTTWRSTR